MVQIKKISDPIGQTNYLLCLIRLRLSDLIDQRKIFMMNSKTKIYLIREIKNYLS